MTGFVHVLSKMPRMSPLTCAHKLQAVYQQVVQGLSGSICFVITMAVNLIAEVKGML